MTFFLDSMSVPVVGTLGSTMSLLDLLKQQYGEDFSKLESVEIQWRLPTSMTTDASYWESGNHHDTKVLGTDGHAITAGTMMKVNAADFANVRIEVGNNIASNVEVKVTEASVGGFTGQQFSVTTLQPKLDIPTAADHIPTAMDIVAAAQKIGAQATADGAHAPNDCHNIAMAIAASAGATLDPLSGNSNDPTKNEESGFWRVAYRGSDPGAVADWQTLVKPGDIVRMQRQDGGEHTVTVTGAINAAGQIMVVDNANGDIKEHLQDFNDESRPASTLTKPGSITIYRLTNDNVYLNDQHTDSNNTTILGSEFNDLIKGGIGNNTLSGGHGDDTLDGDAGDDTAIFHGKQSDYKISVVDGKTAIITDLRAGSPDGTDTIKNIEHVKFGDAAPVNFSDLKTTPVEPVKVAPSVSISDVTITEGSNGSHTETFTVKRTGGDAAFDVNFATADGSAKVADGDYSENHGKLHFDAGVNEQKISIVVNGDTKVEQPTENFKINLSGATNGAVIADGEAVITIKDDDVAKPVAPSVSIGDKTITEGSNGSHIETFTVTRTGGDGAFDVHYATAAGSTSGANGDYTATGGDLHFAAGVNAQTISVVINGDTKVEPTETFKINLSGATNGAVIADGEAVITIKDDDVAKPVAPSVSIGDKTITEGSNGSHVETFTVTRTGGDGAFDVHYATAAGSASGAAGDYTAKGGDLHFDAGVNTQTISIVVNGDTKVEPNETFKINLSNATNGAVIADGEAVVTIKDDDVATTHHAANDFNGDGMSDLLLAKTNGSLALWELNGNHVDANVTVGSVVPAGWHIDGIADFNNDGKSDVLLHNDSGKVAMWQMDGNHVASNTTVGSVGSDWHVIGTADFSGDGKADVLWENAKGQVAMWQMDGDHVASNTAVSSIGSDWKVIGTDDFNGDGKADVLWENSKGQVAMWQMDGSHVTSNTAVASIGSDWHAAGTGDFNGDGKADVLWQNAAGKVAMWQMDGDHVASNTSVGPAAGWSVIGTGDYNHDGKADVLFENAAGKVAQWQMDGDHIDANLSVGSHSTDWHHV